MDQRSILLELIERTGSNYAAISALLSRNPAYIQQFITRGVPQRLSARDQDILARHFGMPNDFLRRGLLASDRAIERDVAAHIKAAIEGSELLQDKEIGVLLHQALAKVERASTR